ncbi:MAG: acdA 2 [Gammaproteobacteria bacterium]|jgi:alkylation response protein AidB-like acyl-CoA dehydrogenase|nr:acdA 2 [Gammaproteobacteria bacterium]
MDFHFSPEQIAMQDMVSDFMQEQMMPHAAAWDEDSFFPKEVLRHAAQLGLAGICIAGDVGGSQLTRLDYVLIFEILAKACPSTAAYLSIHNMVTGLIDRFGSVEQRQRFIPKLVSLEYFSSYCLTEPATGSDAANLKTTATRNGDHYILNGSKAFISGAGESDVYLCMVRTGAEGAKGISCIVVEKDTPGFSIGKKEVKLGWHSQPTAMLFFENCKVPLENRIGGEGQGFNIALSALNSGRLGIAACSLGGANHCFDLARRYTHEREQFKQRLSDFQSIQFRLADMYTQLEAARLAVYRAAFALDVKDDKAPVYVAMAKQLATDTGFNVCNEALQLHGGYGYLRDYPIERYLRDLRVHQILEGTNEIMRVIIAKSLLSEME